MLTYHQQGPVTFIWRQFHKRYLSHQSINLAWKLFIYFFISISHGPMLLYSHPVSLLEFFMADQIQFQLWKQDPYWFPVSMKLTISWLMTTRAEPIFCLLLRVSSDYAQPITGQVTEVTCPVIGRAQPELTPSKRQKIGPGVLPTDEQGLSQWEMTYARNYLGCETNYNSHVFFLFSHLYPPQFPPVWPWELLSLPPGDGGFHVLVRQSYVHAPHGTEPGSANQSTACIGLKKKSLVKTLSKQIQFPFQQIQNSVRCCYNAVNFLQTPHNRHPIARPWGRAMGCLLWIQIPIYVLPQ